MDLSLDNFYIHLKFMMVRFNDSRTVAGSIVPVYLNMVMQAEDHAIEMTQLYPTDEEQRARNPAGQKGVSTAMIAAFLGKESFANISANISEYDPSADCLLNPKYVMLNLQSLCTL